MNTRDAGIAIVAVLLAVVGGWYIYTHPSGSTSISDADESAVRAQVTGFGAHMQLVSLLAPTTERSQEMSLNYGPYLTPELLAEWQLDGSAAIGRQTSSPWPERVEIASVRVNGDNFVVEGNVIEVTSVGVAAVYTVTLTLEKRGGSWLIASTTRGAYSELPQRQTIIGYWECLPHKVTTGPQTMECAFGVAVDKSDGHYAVDTSLMSRTPADYPTGTKVRVEGVVTPVETLSSIQKYDIDGIIRATMIEEL